jgi:hypothetical protein
MAPSNFNTQHLLNSIMSAQSQEARVLLALQVVRTSQKMNVTRVAKLYNVPRSTLRDRLRGKPQAAEVRNSNLKLTSSEEETIVQYVLDLDSRGFPPRIYRVKDMADLLLTTRGATPVGKQWAYNFIRRRPELKTRFSRAYDFQRALCEDPELIDAWFRLVANMRAKYGIQDEDFYNFDETGFMMGVICSSMVVTRADRRGRGKQLQPGNREWATAIECICSDGFALPPFLIVQGKNHLASWYTDTNLPPSWVVKPSPNGWTDNETAMDWIRHFDQHTGVRRKGVYRMIVLDGHESHISAQFDQFCKEKNIITLCLPAHSSHLTQPCDVGCFSVLKRSYGKELEDFIMAHINHITKPEFFIAFKAAHFATMTPENIKAGFRGAGLVPYNPQAVLSKLDVKLRTPTPTGPLLPEADPWVSQTPHGPAEAVSQSNLVRNRISIHQGSSPTSMFSAVKQLAKGTELIAQRMVLIEDELRTLRKANQALAKRRRAKRTRLQVGGALTIEDAQVLLATKATGGQESREGSSGGGPSEVRPATQRRCGRCGKPGHNIRSCQEVEETSDEGSCIECN